MKKLKVFETFAGIGSQHKALEYLKSKYGYDYEVVATSEWDIDAIIAYASIHYPKFDASRSEYAEREREREPKIIYQISLFPLMVKNLLIKANLKILIYIKKLNYIRLIKFQKTLEAF